MKTLIIMQGAPGSGKSTVAASIALRYHSEGLTVGVCSADHFFMGPNGYRFDGSKLSEAHAECQYAAKAYMALGTNIVIVDNTNVKKAHAQRYAHTARQYGYTVQVIRCCGDFDNVHGVPADKVAAMREGMEDLSGLATKGVRDNG